MGTKKKQRAGAETRKMRGCDEEGANVVKGGGGGEARGEGSHLKEPQRA